MHYKNYERKKKVHFSTCSLIKECWIIGKHKVEKQEAYAVQFVAEFLNFAKNKKLWMFKLNWKKF